MSLGWLTREEKRTIKDIDMAIMKLKHQQQSCYNKYIDISGNWYPRLWLWGDQIQDPYEIFVTITRYV